MGYSGEGHQTWYRICPKLPYTYCGNLLLTFLFIIFLPAVLVIGPAIAIMFYTGFYLPFILLYDEDKERSRCTKLSVYLPCMLILTPICLAVGMGPALIVGALALVPLYYYSIHFFVRLSIAGCRAKL